MPRKKLDTRNSFQILMDEIEQGNIMNPDKEKETPNQTEETESTVDDDPLPDFLDQAEETNTDQPEARNPDQQEDRSEEFSKVRTSMSNKEPRIVQSASPVSKGVHPNTDNVVNPKDEYITTRPVLGNKKDIDESNMVNPEDKLPGIYDTVPMTERPYSAKMNQRAIDMIIAKENEVPREQPKRSNENVQHGKTIYGEDASLHPENIKGMPVVYAQQAYKFAANGLRTKGVIPLDTGEGAQEAPKKPKRKDVKGRNDPRDTENFVTCVNRSCDYREGCMRYRLSNKSKSNSIFYPENCLEDGNYIPVSDYPNFTAYDKFTDIDDPLPPTDLPDPV